LDVYLDLDEKFEFKTGRLEISQEGLNKDFKN
jgi:hypothetical protein